MALLQRSADYIKRLNSLVRGGLVEHVVDIKQDATARGVKTYALGFDECRETFLEQNGAAIARFKLEAALPTLGTKQGKRFMDCVNEAIRHSGSGEVEALIDECRERAIQGSLDLFAHRAKTCRQLLDEWSKASSSQYLLVSKTSQTQLHRALDTSTAALAAIAAATPAIEAHAASHAARGSDLRRGLAVTLGDDIKDQARNALSSKRRRILTHSVSGAEIPKSDYVNDDATDKKKTKKAKVAKAPAAAATAPRAAAPPVAPAPTSAPPAAIPIPAPAFAARRDGARISKPTEKKAASAARSAGHEA